MTGLAEPAGRMPRLCRARTSVGFDDIVHEFAGAETAYL